MNYTQKDKERERQFMEIVVPQMPAIAGLDIVQDQDPAALYDFYCVLSGVIIARLDVKVVTETSTKYGTHFISKEKTDLIKNEPGVRHFIAYAFLEDNRIVAYELDNMILSERTLDFIHKRTGEHIVQVVGLVPAHKFYAQAFFTMKRYAYT